MFSEIGDNELIYLIRNNNYEAKDVLINRYTKRIYGMIKSFALKKGLVKDYEDYYQDCFIVFLKCLDFFDNEYNFFLYLKSAINRNLQNALKKEQLDKEVYSLDYFIDKDDNLALIDTIADSSYDYGNSDINMFVEENFNEDEKEIIDLRLKGYSINDISIIKKINKKKVCKILKKIKNRLILVQ